jgi:hypothetical protein
MRNHRLRQAAHVGAAAALVVAPFDANACIPNPVPDPRKYCSATPLDSAAAIQKAFNSLHTQVWSGADGGVGVCLGDG